MRRPWETEDRPVNRNEEGEGVPRVRISYEVITEDSAWEGAAAERGWDDQKGVPMLDDGEDRDDLIDNTVRFLKKNGASEPSSSQFHAGVWYTNFDPDIEVRSGKSTYRSYHLVEFTRQEEQEIFNEVNPNSARNRASRKWR